MVPKAALDNRRDAIQDFSKSISINPNYSWSYKNRGSAYEELRDFKRGNRELHSGDKKLDPKFAFAYAKRGYCKNNTADYKRCHRRYYSSYSARSCRSMVFRLPPDLLKDKRMNSKLPLRISINHSNFVSGRMDISTKKRVAESELGDLGGIEDFVNAMRLEDKLIQRYG